MALSRRNKTMSKKARIILCSLLALLVGIVCSVLSLSDYKLIPPAGDGCWYAMEGTYWEQIPHSREKIVGKIILNFQDSVASRTLYAPKTGLSSVMARAPYTTSAEGVRIDSLLVNFIGQDTLFYFVANGEQMRFARIPSDSVAQIASETEDLSTLVFNNELALAHYARNTRFYPIEEPGMLLSLIKSTPEQVLKTVETLCVCGPMNGLDIIALRFLLADEGALSNIRRLDLSRAWIVTDSIPYNLYSYCSGREFFDESEGSYRRVATSEDLYMELYEMESSRDTIDVVRSVEGYLYELEYDSLYMLLYTTIEDVIGRCMFDKMPYLEEVVLPYSLQEISPFAFFDCPRLRRVCYPATSAGIRIFEANGNRFPLTARDESELYARFVNCDQNIRFEPYGERVKWPKVRFTYNSRPAEYIGRGEFERFDTTVHMTQNSLIRVNYDLEIIVEANAHVDIDFKAKTASGAPLTTAYSNYCASIRPLANNLERLNYDIQREWRGDSIIAMERRIGQAKSEILSHLVRACIENKTTPIPAYLIMKYQECLSTAAMQYLLMILDDENAFSRSTQVLRDWLKVKSRKDDFDWDALADTTLMHLVRVPQPGMLQTILTQEYDPARKPMQRLRVEGTLNSDDLACLSRVARHLDVLDLTRAEIGIYLPDSLFYCSNLRYVRLPETLETIGEDAFCGNVKLQQVVFPQSLISIRSEAFWGCVNLRHIDFPERLQFIESKSFMRCINLREVRLPDSLYSVDYLAFSGCPFLTYIYIPEGTVSIGMNLTLNSPLAKVEVHPNNKYFAAFAGHLVGLTESSRKILHQYEPFGTAVNKKKK